MKFSGHDTFACRTSWLYKGVDFIVNQAERGTDPLQSLTKGESTVQLGVGKNMLNAIKHWLMAYGLYNAEDQELTQIAGLIYAGDGEINEGDTFVEDRFTLWVLHHEICTNRYATIYHFFFQEYFRKKSTRTFSETEFLAALTSWIVDQDAPLPSINSLKSDFRCLIDTYCLKKSKKASLEDNFTTLLTELSLIRRTEFKTADNEDAYEINTLAAEEISSELFATLLLKTFAVDDHVSISLDEAYLKLGTVLLLNREAYSEKLEVTASKFSNTFSFKLNPATGIEELQIQANQTWMEFALANHY
jgi:hypothetical protein